jgi:hypothetical protein
VTANERRETGDAAACRIPDDRLLVMLPSSKPSDQSLRLSAVSTVLRLVVLAIFLNGAFGTRLSPYGVVTL